MDTKHLSWPWLSLVCLFALLLAGFTCWTSKAYPGNISPPVPSLVDTTRSDHTPPGSPPGEPAKKIKIPAEPLSAVSFHEPPIILKIRDILPANLCRGSNYVIMDKVQNDGIINVYDIQTSYGMTRIESTPALLIRINELKAIEKMEQMKQTSVFKEALVSGVKAPVKLAGDVLKAPVETAGKVAVGTGNFLSNVARSIFSSDPHQDNVLKVAVGYDAAKRKFAYEFQINPYTDYDPVVEQLGEISRAAVAGGIVPRVAMQAVGGPAGTALGLTATAKSMKKLVRDNAPAELEKINRKKLLEMGVSQDLCDAFLENYKFDPETTTILVGELYSMKGVQGRDLFIAVAALAETGTRALMYRIMAGMMAKYHSSYARARRIGLASGIPYLVNDANVAVFQLPLDYVFWTRHVAAKLSDIDKDLHNLTGIRAKEMWLSGKMDTDAQRQFSRRGWTVVQDVIPLK
ncbi:MAG: hypothetical protein DSZ23_01075 [Thermodesulfatator sp.]|nr:MAG: hypothetical protein DSZ23_01075 [Thermodesulfatator sp.]